MKILALIPARGGSKRLPGKNIKLLGDKPLINWTIEVAQDIPEICEILVSTDNSEIASIAKVAGAKVPWLRPAHLSTDVATSVDVAIHAIDWYEKEICRIDGLMLLQPTSPFRTKLTIQEGINLFKEFNQQPIIGVSPSQSHPQWALKQQGEFIVPFMKDHKIGIRSQELTASFTPTACSIWCHQNTFGENIHLAKRWQFLFTHHP